MEYRLQSMYNHMVGLTASVVSPFYSLLPMCTLLIHWSMSALIHTHLQTNTHYGRGQFPPHNTEIIVSMYCVIYKGRYIWIFFPFFHRILRGIDTQNTQDQIPMVQYSTVQYNSCSTVQNSCSTVQYCCTDIKSIVTRL